MFSTSYTDLFTSPAQTLTNPVNTHGVSGAGLARQFRMRYPAMYRAYQAACRAEELQIGVPWLWTRTLPYILCFPTKAHWSNPSQLDYIRSGLNYLIHHLDEWHITSLAVPLLGCGLGELNTDDVLPLMQEAFDPLPIPVTLHILPSA